MIQWPVNNGFPNPCEFCADKQIINLTNKEQDVIQVDIDGNDTTLFIRETSVEDCRKKKDERKESVIEGEQLSPSVENIYTPLPDSLTSQVGPPSKTFKSDVLQLQDLEQTDLEDKNTHRKQLDRLYIKKWSGNTYFEEEFRKIRENEYQKGIAKQMRIRKLWRAFQKELKRDRRRDLIRSSGPEWWQEPSVKQICLAISLNDTINSDYEEEVTGRTRQWLLDLGVTTRVTPKQVRDCMKRSLLNPIDFLLEIHAVILKSQLNLKKKRGDLERPFSINERLLLSAVCVLHLPTFLTILHYILPPPKPWSTEKHIQELLFGDLEDERIRYSTPYMEPLPFRNLTHFTDWCFDQVFRAILPSILADEEITIPKEHKESLNLAIPSMETTFKKQRRETNASDQGKDVPKYSRSETSDSITWLISQFISKRDITLSLYPIPDSEASQSKFFNRKLTAKTLAQDKFQSSETKGLDEDDNGQGPISFVEETSNVSSSQPKRSETVSFYEGSLSGDKQSPLYAVPSDLNGNDIDINILEDILESPSNLSKPPTILRTMNKLDMGKKVEIEEEESEIKLESNNEAKNTELRKIWSEINELPKKEQLQRAITVLKEMGDPLARLPQVWKLPTIQRWLELRQGKHRILSKETKEELLTRSRGMWKTACIGSSTEGPKIKCSKRFERMLTWDRKKWLESEVRKEMNSYYTRVRQEKVENTRQFFPSMLNHYDHGSKLNRNFREVYFTYLPSREADTFVYRPWQPQETKNANT